jgi:hypothetical protein
MYQRQPNTLARSKGSAKLAEARRFGLACPDDKLGPDCLKDGQTFTFRGQPRLLCALGTEISGIPAATRIAGTPRCPRPPGAVKRPWRSLVFFHSKSILYGAFVWARRALNRLFRWFSARAVRRKDCALDTAACREEGYTEYDCKLCLDGGEKRKQFDCGRLLLTHGACDPEKERKRSDFCAGRTDCDGTMSYYVPLASANMLPTVVAKAVLSLADMNDISMTVCRSAMFSPGPSIQQLRSRCQGFQQPCVCLLQVSGARTVFQDFRTWLTKREDTRDAVKANWASTLGVMEAAGAAGVCAGYKKGDASTCTKAEAAALLPGQAYLRTNNYVRKIREQTAAAAATLNGLRDRVCRVGLEPGIHRVDPESGSTLRLL